MEDVEVKKVVIHAGDAPFVIEVDTGLTLQVQSDQSASVFFPRLSDARISIEGNSGISSASHAKGMALMGLTAAAAMAAGGWYWWYSHQ